MSPGNPVPSPKKGISPVVVILIVIGGLILLGGLLLVAGGLFFVHKARQAGIDTELLQKNPALAATKLIAAINPDVEVVRVDEASGKIELRDKKTGKTVLLDFEDVKKGRITFETDEGKMTVGATTGKVPDWAPKYPGSEQTHVATTETAEGHRYTLHSPPPTPSSRLSNSIRRNWRRQASKQAPSSTASVRSYQDEPAATKRMLP
jgi:hypothetical protein